MGHQVAQGEIAQPNTKWIWKVFWILLVITTVEVTLAYVWPASMSVFLLNVIFISLTLVKAFYIVAEFMHLGHEVKALAMTIILPLIFVLWFVVAMIVDGSFWLECRQYFIQ